MIFAHDQDFKRVQSQGTNLHVDGRLAFHAGQQPQMPGNIRRRIALEINRRQPAKMPVQQGRLQVAAMMANGLQEVYHLFAPIRADIFSRSGELPIVEGTSDCFKVRWQSWERRSLV